MDKAQDSTKTVSSLSKTINNLLKNMVYVPGGSFIMGSSMSEVERCVSFWSKNLVEPTFTADRFRQWILKEFPNHEVQVAPFWMSRFPVTNRQYRCFLVQTGYPAPESICCQEPEDHPVWGVTLDDVKAFIAWLNCFAVRPYRLPREAEWEYAAKGLSGWEYPFGNTFDPSHCNTIESGIGHSTPVYRYAEYASEFGICDMAGNVEEWTADNYTPYPGGLFIEDDLVVKLGPRYPILRGGSFARGGDLARSARRHGPYPEPAYKYIGFRLAA